MKKKLTVFAAVLAIIFVGLALPSYKGYAQYNDEAYSSYKNMTVQSDSKEEYYTPSIFRQDEAYKNAKRFPLVIKETVEYVPIEVFAQFSYLELVYSKLSYGFYINNTKNNHYVAFNLETGTTTTHEYQIVDLKSELFYRTNYVPAKSVCEILDINFESFDSKKDGIYAVRVSDSKAKSTFNELLNSYSPSSKPPSTDNPWGSTDNPGIDIGDKETYKNTAARKIYLTFENYPAANTANVLNVLKKYDAKAIFFINSESILSNAETVRQIKTDGHEIGIYYNPAASAADVYTNEKIISDINDANDKLNLVTKSKTRLLRLSYGYFDKLSENGFAKAAKDAGFVLFDWNCDSADYSGNVNAASESLVNSVTGGNKLVERTVIVRFGPYEVTDDILDIFLAFCTKYAQFEVLPPDAFVQPVSFVAM